MLRSNAESNYISEINNDFNIMLERDGLVINRIDMSDRCLVLVNDALISIQDEDFCKEYNVDDVVIESLYEIGKYSLSADSNSFPDVDSVEFNLEITSLLK